MDDSALIAAGAVILVNVFTPHVGRTDDFVAAQTAEYLRLKGQVEGALGNRLLRGLDGRKVVNIAYFESVALYEAWVGSALFQDHLSRIKHLVEQVEPALFRQVYGSA